MGPISEKLARRSAKLSRQFRQDAKTVPVPKDVRDVGTLVKDGYDPLHAVYISVQNTVILKVAEHWLGQPRVAAFARQGECGLLSRNRIGTAPGNVTAVREGVADEIRTTVARTDPASKSTETGRQRASVNPAGPGTGGQAETWLVKRK